MSTLSNRRKETAAALSKNGRKILEKLRSSFLGCYYQLSIPDQGTLLNRLDTLATYLDAPDANCPCAAHLAAQEAAGILTRYGADLEKLRTYLNEI